MVKQSSLIYEKQLHQIIYRLRNDDAGGETVRAQRSEGKRLDNMASLQVLF